MKIRSVIVGAAFACSATMLSSTAFAWEQIGYQQADFSRDRDAIVVRGNDRHTKIRVCVEQRPVHMRDLDVVFANGGRQDVKVRKLIGAGTCTRAIDLKGKARNIARIVVVYDKIVPGKPAIMKVYAR